MRVLIVGGSGYLGQFLLKHLLESPEDDVIAVGYTYADETTGSIDHPVTKNDRCRAFRVDAATGEGMDACVSAMSPLDLVVNCAAMSSPGKCEKEAELAMNLNVPKHLCKSLMDHHSGGVSPLLVHLSTDQVYDGESGNSVEDVNAPSPVNTYGRSKLSAEVHIEENYAAGRHVSLRSSIITGSQPPLRPVSRPLFHDFIVNSLKGDTIVPFFEDEFRCPIAAVDIAAHVVALSKLAGKDAKTDWLARYNMGGPDRLSHVDMAKQTAEVLGVSDANVAAVPSASVDRGVKSPADISMLSDKLNSLTGVTPMGWKDQMRLALGLAQS